MSNRNFFASKDLIVVSANAKETALNTEQTLDTSMMVALGDVIQLEGRRENNAGEMTGYEEPDTIYDLGGLAKWSFNFEKMQPQHAAFILAYGLGKIVSTARGTGRLHTITPIDGEHDDSRSNPTFTAAMRLGNQIAKRRFASFGVDSFTMSFAKDAWVKLSGQVVGTGKHTDNITTESVNAAGTATSLVLAAVAVQGSDAASRLANVHRIRVDLLANGVFTEVAFTAVSAATPAVITIVAPSVSATPVNYQILYVPTEPAWCTFPSRVTETPLRTSELTVQMGGAWNGTTFSGGNNISSQINSVEWSYGQGMKAEFVPGAGGSYAGRMRRDGRTQTLKLTREMRDWVLQQSMKDNEYMGVRILAEGALYDGVYKYQVELIFPRVSVLTAPISVDGKRLAEAGDLQILEDPVYGSVIAKVQNLVTNYAA